MDPSNGEPIKGSTTTINGVQINSSSCACDPNNLYYWWYDGKSSTEVNIIGNIDKKQITKLLNQLTKN